MGKEPDLILVTGGAGTMGLRLTRALLARGHAVRALCLPGDPAAAKVKALGAEAAFGDIADPASLAPVLSGVNIVYHLAAVVLSPGRPEVFLRINADGTRNLVSAAEAAGVSHFIYVSSISVAYPRGNAYARSKARGEAYVKAAARMRWTIVRPSLAYEDGGAAEFMAFVAHLRRGRAVWLPAGGRARKRPVHVEDLAAGFLALPGNPVAYGKTYVFSGGEALALREMAASLLDHMGGRKPIRGLPAWICLGAVAAAWVLAKATGRPPVFTWQTYTGLVQDADFPPDLARAELDFAPRPFRDGVAALASLRGCLGPR
jgi:nucleoside-diphosphate-sugar epimerase